MEDPDPEIAAGPMGAGRRKLQEKHLIGCLGCCGVIGLGAFAGLIVLLNSIHTLGPEDQVLVEGPTGRYVRNGPSTVVLAIERKKTFRTSTRIMRREFALLKNIRTGELRHVPGPGAVFLGPWDSLEKIKSVTTLQRDEYLRLVDKMTGSERVIAGPKMVIPAPLEEFPKGIEKAVILGVDRAVVARNKTTGMLRLVTDGGAYVPAPYEEIVEVRVATVLSHKQYAVLKSFRDGGVRHVAGPTMFQVGAYEELAGIVDKVILRKDEYIRLRNKKDGSERIVRGPIAFIPDPLEQAMEGKQRATFLDLDTAALVLNRGTGQQRLVTEKGVFIPSPYEQVLEKRQLIRVLPHEAMVVRDAGGQVQIIGGGGTTSKSFFLQPYWSVLDFTWSAFSELIPPSSNSSRSVEQTSSKVTASKIDMRSQKMFFRYSVFTSDNVKLVLDGTIFWRPLNVAKMVNTTSDPSGDVWHHSRSALIQAVSKTTLPSFMASLSSVSVDAFQSQAQDGFYAERGVSLESIELTRFEVADPTTGELLQDIIMETTNRINRLQQQASFDEVRKASLTMDIAIEKKRTQLVIYRATNERLQAEMAGDIEGLKRLGFATQFIGGLNRSVPDLDTRLDLYGHFQRLQSQKDMTRDIAAGGKRFFLTPADLDLSLKIEL